MPPLRPGLTSGVASLSCGLGGGTFGAGAGGVMGGGTGAGAGGGAVAAEAFLAAVPLGASSAAEGDAGSAAPALTRCSSALTVSAA